MNTDRELGATCTLRTDESAVTAYVYRHDLYLFCVYLCSSVVRWTCDSCGAARGFDNLRGMFKWLEGLIKSADPARDALGPRGENVAAKHLRNLGYKIIERNFR